jgi:hypothetical protein
MCYLFKLLQLQIQILRDLGVFVWAFFWLSSRISTRIETNGWLRMVLLPKPKSLIDRQREARLGVLPAAFSLTTESLYLIAHFVSIIYKDCHHVD